MTPWSLRTAVTLDTHKRPKKSLALKGLRTSIRTSKIRLKKIGKISTPNLSQNFDVLLKKQHVMLYLCTSRMKKVFELKIEL